MVAKPELHLSYHEVSPFFSLGDTQNLTIAFKTKKLKIVLIVKKKRNVGKLKEGWDFENPKTIPD